MREVRSRALHTVCSSCSASIARTIVVTVTVDGVTDYEKSGPAPLCSKCSSGTQEFTRDEVPESHERGDASEPETETEGQMELSDD